MRTINIEKEVSKKVQQRRDSVAGFKLVLETQKLLEYDNTRDRILMRKMTPHCTEVYAENEQAKVIEMENLEKTFGDKLVPLDYIQKLAFNYRLRFLPSTLFKGSMSPEVVSAVRRYCEKAEIDMNDHNLTSKFFILAPAGLFTLSEGVERQKLVQESEASKLARARRIERMLTLDPSIFFKVNENEYAHIKTWGKDFNVLRRVKGFVMKSHSNFMLTMFTIFTLLLSVSSYYFLNSFVTNRPFIAALLVGTAALVLAASFLFGYDGYFSSQVWNSSKKNEDRSIIIN